MRQDKEHDLQVACVRWFRLQYPHKIIFAIPNGGARNVIVAAKMKAEGVLKGVPDLFIPEPAGTYAGLWIEMKVKPNRPSPEQKDLMHRLTNRLYRCEVCYSFEEFVEIINSYLNDKEMETQSGAHAGRRGFMARLHELQQQQND